MEFVRMPDGLRPKAGRMQVGAGARAHAAAAAAAPASHNPAHAVPGSADAAPGLSGAGTAAGAAFGKKTSLVTGARRPPKHTSPIRVRAQSPTTTVDLDLPSLTRTSQAALAALSPAESGLRAHPVAVHFAGFSLDGRLERALVRVRNVSADAQRVSVSPVDPSADDGACFRVEVDNAGRVAPGLSQDFTVVFRPSALRYHYASVRIVGETGEVVVPLHAYPVATSFSFPERLDFGRVALLDAAVRRVTLTTGVPIPFAFRIEALSPHPDLVVEPMEGVIPPHGSVDVLLAYRPTTLTTARAELLVHTAQHNWTPLKVTVVGSSHPGARRDAGVAEAVVSSARLKASGPGALRAGEGWGSAGGDGGNGGGSPTSSGPLSPLEAEAAAGSASDGESGSASDGDREGKDGKDGEEYPTTALHTARPPRPRAQRGPVGDPSTGPAGMSQRGAGMTRWLRRDPGLGVLDDKLEAFKRSQEERLIHSLEERSAIVDQLAAAMHVATGAEVSRAEAVELVRQVTGARTAAIDDYSAGDGADKDAFLLVGGVRVPKNLRTMKDVTFVLNQKDGKLLPSDIKRAVRAQRLASAASSAAQSRVRAMAARGSAGGADDDDDGDNNNNAEGEGTNARSASPTLSLTGYGSGGSTGSSSPGGRRAGAGGSRSGSRSPSRGRGGSPTSLNRTTSTKVLAKTSGADSFVDISGMAAARRAERHAKVLAGPGLRSSALAAGTLSASWLFPALQGLKTTDLPRILLQLAATPDHFYVETRSPLDELLGSVGAVLLGSRQENLYHHKDYASGLPPALAALVQASASPLIDPRVLRESVFITETTEIAKAETAREFSLYPWTGEHLVSAHTVSRVRRLRALLLALQDIVARRLLRTRRTTLAIPAGGLAAMAAVQMATAAAAAVHDNGAEADAAAGAALDVVAQAARGPAGSNPVLASPVVRAALLPLSRPVVPYGTPAARTPTFAEVPTAGVWALRKDAVDRFRAAVTTRIVRARVDARLELLLAKLQSASTAAAALGSAAAALGGGAGAGAGGGDSLTSLRAAVADLVDREHRRAQIEGQESWIVSRPARSDLAAATARAQQNDKANGGSSGGGHAAAGGSPRKAAHSGETLLFHINPARVARVSFPVAPVDDGTDGATAAARGWDLNAPLAAAVPAWYCEAAPFAEAAWPDEEVMGYTPLPVPAAPFCQPREDARPLRDGNLHETAASGLLPLPSSQSSLDPRLAAAVRSAQVQPLRPAALGLAAEPFLLRHVWAELGAPHPSVRALPPSCPHSGDAATGLSEAGASEADPAYLLHPYAALAEPYAAAHPDMPSAVTGVAHAHATGMGVGVPPPPLPGLLNAGLSSSGAAEAAVAAAARAAAASRDLSPLDANGSLPTAGQVYGAQMGFSSLRHLQAPPAQHHIRGTASGAALLAHAAAGTEEALPQPLFFAHAYTPALSRPALDLAVPLLAEVPPPPPSASAADDGAGPALRLPTDVLPLAARVYIPNPAERTSDPWSPSAPLPLLARPRVEDLLSDDSESDPDGEGGGGGGGGGWSSGSERGISPLPSSSRAGTATSAAGKPRAPRRSRAPTLSRARALFLPPSMTKSAAQASRVRFGGGGSGIAGDNESVASATTFGGVGGGADAGGRSGTLRARLGLETASASYLATQVDGGSSIVLGGASADGAGGVDGGPSVQSSGGGSVAPGGGGGGGEGRPFVSLRDAALLDLTVSGVEAAHGATYWLSGATIGTHGPSGPAGSVNAGISDPRRHVVMAPE
jgi:hypothetical protein